MSNEREPYAWAVSGLGGGMFFGEYAECDAKATAKRCGGTAEAFPLYRRAASGSAEQPSIPGLEADPSAFVRWAARNGYDMTCHPLHFLFLNEKTHAARCGWRACRDHYSAASPSAPKEG